MDLPKLTKKQQSFVMRYVVNGDNASDAYRFAYKTEGMTDNTINVEASRLLKNPKVAQWIAYYKSNVKKVCDEEVLYSAKQAFEELNDLQSRCSVSSKTFHVEKSCIDTKCKIAGLFSDVAVSNAVSVNMPSITLNGQELEFNIGENA